MKQDLNLRLKWTLRAHGRQMVFIKKAFEGQAHVVTKALLWALYLPEYPDVGVEMRAEGRYKPDLVQFDSRNKPVFWAEAGRVSQRKLARLVQKYRNTHLVFAKFNKNLQPLQTAVNRLTRSIQRTAAIDLISFPPNSEARFIRDDGTVEIKFEDVTLVRL